MLKINRQDHTFSTLDSPTMASASISERYDLQEFICNSPEAFFKELGYTLFLVGKEITPSENVQDRIDVLAIDKDGSSIIVELKRGNHKLHMLQAISYAGMVAQWSADDVFNLLDDDKQEALVDFLEVDRDDVNRSQRIILVAEAYDYALLVGAEWLSEQFGVDITCCRISVATDSGAEYFVCGNVFPTPELAQQAIPRGRGARKPRKLRWTDWDSALANVTNQTVVTFFKSQIEKDCEHYLRKRILRYRLDGKRRWFIAARKKNAYVWQHGRFDNDVEFWQGGLSDPSVVSPVKEGQCLRFFLETEDDFQFFLQSASTTLTSKTWSSSPPDDDTEDSAE